MAEFALLIDGALREFRRYESRPEDIAHKGVQWFPVVRSYGEPFEGVEGDTYVVRTVDPATLPPPIPESISPRQARLALLEIGKLDTANAVVAAADNATRISWEFATAILRADPGVIAFAGAIGIDAAGLDQLFIRGAQF
jgi:hypothetical protein